MGGDGVSAGLATFLTPLAADEQRPLQGQGHRLEHADQDAVARGQCQSLVKAHIGAVEQAFCHRACALGIKVNRHVAHGLQGAFDGGDRGSGGPTRGKCGGLHLQRQAQFDQIEDAFGVVLQNGADEIAQGGGTWFAHAGSPAARQVDQAAPGKGFQRLAHRHAADLVLQGQISLAWQAVAGLQVLTDMARKVIGNPCGRGPFGRFGKCGKIHRFGPVITYMICFYRYGAFLVWFKCRQKVNFWE